MNSILIVLTVLVQVLVFQFLAVAFTRSVFVVRLGSPPEPVAAKVAGYLQKAARSRYLLGAILLALAIVIRWVLPLSVGMAKLSLAVVSLVSAFAFVAAVVRDRNFARAAQDELPEAGIRRASLAARPSRYWYSPYWELVPICLVGITCVYVYWLTLQLTTLPAMIWVWLGVQVVFAFGALWYAARWGMRVPNVSRRLAMLRKHPELALKLGERLAANEARYFMPAKVLVTLLLGLKVLREGMEAMGSAGVETVALLKWLLVGLLILTYVLFILQLGRITKGAMREAEGNTARAGQ